MEKDKILHLVIGFILALLTMLLTGSVPFALFLAFGVGIIKEWYDYMSGKGMPEFLELFVTLLGGVLGVFVFYAMII